MRWEKDGVDVQSGERGKSETVDPHGFLTRGREWGELTE